jgi:hypothetical protein
VRKGSSVRRGSWIPQETLTSYNYPSQRLPTKHGGFGGFPMPHEIAKNLFSYLFPKLQRRLTRTITLPRTTTLASRRGDGVVGAKPAPYISFDVIVGRNSAFHQLTREQQDELGGVEYRALKALLWIVAGVGPVSCSNEIAPKTFPVSLWRSVDRFHHYWAVYLTE